MTLKNAYSLHYMHFLIPVYVNDPQSTKEKNGQLEKEQNVGCLDSDPDFH